MMNPLETHILRFRYIFFNFNLSSVCLCLVAGLAGRRKNYPVHTVAFPGGGGGRGRPAKGAGCQGGAPRRPGEQKKEQRTKKKFKKKLKRKKEKKNTNKKTPCLHLSIAKKTVILALRIARCRQRKTLLCRSYFIPPTKDLCVE
jgi:hypothetical protein